MTCAVCARPAPGDFCSDYCQRVWLGNRTDGYNGHAPLRGPETPTAGMKRQYENQIQLRRS